jgi:hypothetical protein
MTMGVYITRAQLAKLDKLNETKDAAMNAIYDAVPNNITPFNDCRALATLKEREAYDSACSARQEFHHKLVAEGRGWFDDSGRFTPNRKRG